MTHVRTYVKPAQLASEEGGAGTGRLFLGHHGTSEFRLPLDAVTRKKIDEDLAYYRATPDEGEQVYQALIHRLAQLALHLRVSLGYLEAVAAGQADLTPRDQEACRLLRRRLNPAKQACLSPTDGRQVGLPFAELPETFTRTHAHLGARARARAQAKS